MLHTARDVGGDVDSLEPGQLLHCVLQHLMQTATINELKHKRARDGIYANDTTLQLWHKRQRSWEYLCKCRVPAMMLQLGWAIIVTDGQ